MLFLYNPVPSLVRNSFFDDDYTTPSRGRVKRPSCPVDHNNDRADRGAFELSLDVPGVKQAEIKVTVDRNFLSIRGETKKNRRSFHKVVTVNPEETDLSQLTAVLSDHGVLTLTAPPKAKPDPLQVTVKTTSNDEVDNNAAAATADERDDDNEPTMMRRSIEIPGVKPSDLQVTLEEGATLHVRGTRRGQAFHKSFRIDADRFSTSELTAQLSHGILTVRAPTLPRPQPQTVEIETTVVGTTDTTADSTTTSDHATEIVSMDLPGVRIQDVTVSTVRVDQHRTALDIRASRNQGNDSSNKKLRISKVVLLDHDTYNVDKLKAQLSDGVLTVFATKKPDAEPRAVPVVAATANTPPKETIENQETTKE
jgi:HSP20 family molecular chaperone IbpA